MSEIRKEVLENGLTILTEKVDHIRSISLGIWLKKGSQNERPEEAGVYHFIEHMLFKGTENRSAYDIARIMDSIGGFNDAFTAKEHTCFYAKVLDEHLPIILDIFSDILIRPKFDPEDIEKERKVIHEEIKMVEDTPSDLVHEIFMEHFFDDHPLGRPILGSIETVNFIDRTILRNCFYKNYVPSNMLVTAAGNVDHDQLVAAIGEYFHLPNPEGQPDPDPGSVVPVPGVVVRTKRDLEQSHLCIGTPGYAADHPGRYAAGCMNVILGASMSSRLFQKIREDRGLCYTIFSSLTSFRNAGYLSIYAATSRETVETALELIIQECREMAKKPVTAEELENAKNHIKGNLILSLESSSNRMFNLARNEMYFGRQISIEETLEKISEVTVDDVQRTAMELFQHSNYGIVVVGDLEELNWKIDSYLTH